MFLPALSAWESWAPRLHADPEGDRTGYSTHRSRHMGHRQAKDANPFAAFFTSHHLCVLGCVCLCVLSCVVWVCISVYVCYVGDHCGGVGYVCTCVGVCEYICVYVGV